MQALTEEVADTILGTLLLGDANRQEFIDYTKPGVFTVPLLLNGHTYLLITVLAQALPQDLTKPLRRVPVDVHHTLYRDNQPVEVPLKVAAYMQNVVYKKLVTGLRARVEFRQVNEPRTYYAILHVQVCIADVWYGWRVNVSVDNARAALVDGFNLHAAIKSTLVSHMRDRVCTSLSFGERLCLDMEPRAMQAYDYFANMIGSTGTPSTDFLEKGDFVYIDTTLDDPTNSQPHSKPTRKVKI